MNGSGRVERAGGLVDRPGRRGSRGLGFRMEPVSVLTWDKGYKELQSFYVGGSIAVGREGEGLPGE